MPAPFSQISTERLHERVARQLRDAILDGTYKPGDRLPVERDLVEAFGVSRSAVRQALLLLQQQGLLLIRQGAGGGVFVDTRQMTPVLQAFENLFALQEPSVGQFIQAKTLLEPVISAAAAEQATPEDLAALRENVERTERAVSEGQAVDDLVLEFHLLVGAAAHNEILTLILEALVRIADRLPSADIGTSADWARLAADHRSIYRAIESGRGGEVEELTRTHLHAVWPGYCTEHRREPE